MLEDGWHGVKKSDSLVLICEFRPSKGFIIPRNTIDTNFLFYDLNEIAWDVHVTFRIFGRQR